MRLLSILLAVTSAGISASSVSPAAAAPAQPANAAAADDARVLAVFKQSIEDARHGRYIAASFGLLANLGIGDAAQIKDPDLFDQWAQVMSAMTGRPTFNPSKSADFHVPPAQLAALRAADGVAAIPEIVRRARGTSIVILDENHLDPHGRAFALQVARALRPLGYTVLAAEALKSDSDDAVSRARMAKLSSDGFVRQSSGYYLNDPVFADFLRQSLALGYRLVAYETARTQFSQEQREQDQTDNLIRRAIHAYPAAKILVYVGEHHAAERPISVESGNTAMLAERVKRATGIDPLTIDQAGLSPIPMNRPDTDLYGIAATKARGRSVVLMHDGAPVTVGLLAGAVDLQIVHPASETVDGRPAWLALLHRKPRPIPPSLLPKSGTRLVQAFVATEPEDAIPIDQVLVTAGRQAPMLMLPPVAVRYAVQDVKTVGATQAQPR